ncbi:MAG: SRPBCC family protein [Nitrospirae bacterium]|nr:SRPBCC family protein [Nitrospirota bacterium]
MLKVFLIALGIVVLAFAAFVASRPGTFRYERSGLINASSEEIYPYLISFKSGSEWNPYEKIDPSMKKSYSGPETGVGSIMEFDGNSDVGSGRLEIINVIPNQQVEIKLMMLRPLKATNIVQYKLNPKDQGTLFTWTMSGDNNFLSKLVSIFINCDKMLGDQFNQGIQNLKTVVES